MNKNTFFVVQLKDIETGRTYAYAESVANCNNLYGYFKPRKGMEIMSINACDTLKTAKEIAHDRNKCAIDNNNYYYGKY